MHLSNFIRRTVSSGVFIFFLAILVFSVASCGSSSGGAASGNRRGGGGQGGNANIPPLVDAGPVVNITVAQAVGREVPAFVQSTGSLVADEASNVAPKIAGKVVNVSVNVGQFVGQGAVLAKIDDRDALLRLAEARAGVTQAIAAVRQAEARLGLSPNGTFNASTIPEVQAANANYQQALAELRQAEANERRYRDLVETGDVSMQNYENYRTIRDTARARVNAAKEQLEAAANAARQNNQAIRAAQAGVEAARAQVGTAEQAVADTVIRAPFSGFISDRPAAPGEYVTSASVIATILRTNPIKLQMQVTEADVPFVTLGKGVSLEVEAYKDRKFAGTVTAVNPAVDPNSRAAVVEASIPNGDNALRPGMFATARIVREGGAPAVFVPRAAIYNDQATQSYRVFVIQENVAKLKVVQLGTEEGEQVQILDGVAADETVAVSNLEQLYEGARVAF
jgi:multidrug efflux pump subunit AcrA (membrane-fusion protein)